MHGSRVYQYDRRYHYQGNCDASICSYSTSLGSFLVKAVLHIPLNDELSFLARARFRTEIAAQTRLEAWAVIIVGKKSSTGKCELHYRNAVHFI